MLEHPLANWPLKLLALALAFAIWAAVTGEQRGVRDFSVPLDLKLPQSRILTSPPPTTVTVRLRGAESLLRRLDTVPMELGVDLSDLAPGNVDVQLTREQLLGVPRGVDVDFIDPDRLSLEIDRRVRKELPVDPVFLGRPPEGYVFYGARVVPPSLMIEGPERDVRTLVVLKTNPIRLDMRKQPFTARVGAVPEGTATRAVDPRPIEVHVDIDAAPVERRIVGLPVILAGESYENNSLTPAMASVVLSGPPRLVDRLLPEQLRLIADVTGLEPRTEPHEVELEARFVDVPIEETSRLKANTVEPRMVRVVVGGRRLPE